MNNEDIIFKKDEQIRRLKDRLSERDRELRNEKDELAEVTEKYLDLKRSCYFLGRESGVIVHLEKQMELYKDLYERLFKHHVAYVKKYEHFYNDLVEPQKDDAPIIAP